MFLNTSNLPQRPIFPYAFVQVSEIARRYGLSVKRLDLLYADKKEWPGLIETLVRRHQPRMVGITLRQADSLSYSDYYNPKTGESCGTFYPVDDSDELISILRQHTCAPIVMGGIGFTSHSKKLFDYLGLDFGVQGDPDSFFENFEDVLARNNLENVVNLIYRNGQNICVNPRGFFAPAPNTEYTDEIVQEIEDFYGIDILWGNNPPTIAVEVMRGCPFDCYFCTEPYVKGKNIRYRDIVIIEEELCFLLGKGLRRFWFVCSELNGPGMHFAYQIAKLIISLNERFPGTPIEWSAYSLPNMRYDELKVLYDSGYAGALNDVLSLDDKNLRDAKVPYKSEQAIRFLKALNKLNNDKNSEKPSTYHTDKKQKEIIATQTPKDLGQMLSLFLGNVHADEKTVANTLKVIEENQLRDLFDRGHVISSTRVFEIENENKCNINGRVPGSMTTYYRNGETSINDDVNVLFPTFHSAEYLLEHLKTPSEVDAFFNYVAKTFLSNSHFGEKDWTLFLRDNTTVDLLSKTVKIAQGVVVYEQAKGVIVNLFDPDKGDPNWWSVEAEHLLKDIFYAVPSECIRVLDYLKVTYKSPHHISVSSYKLAELLYERYDDNLQLIREVKQALSLTSDSVGWLYLHWLIYKFNIQLRPDYKPILFPELVHDTRVGITH